MPTEQLIAMRIHGVNADFIQKARSRGYNDASIERLIELKIRGFEK